MSNSDNSSEGKFVLNLEESNSSGSSKIIIPIDLEDEEMQLEPQEHPQSAQGIGLNDIKKEEGEPETNQEDEPARETAPKQEPEGYAKTEDRPKIDANPDNNQDQEMAQEQTPKASEQASSESNVVINLLVDSDEGSNEASKDVLLMDIKQDEFEKKEEKDKEMSAQPSQSPSKEVNKPYESPIETNPADSKPAEHSPASEVPPKHPEEPAPEPSQPPSEPKPTKNPPAPSQAHPEPQHQPVEVESKKSEDPQTAHHPHDTSRSDRSMTEIDLEHKDLSFSRASRFPSMVHVSPAFKLKQEGPREEHEDLSTPKMFTKEGEKDEQEEKKEEGKSESDQSGYKFNIRLDDDDEEQIVMNIDEDVKSDISLNIKKGASSDKVNKAGSHKGSRKQSSKMDEDEESEHHMITIPFDADDTPDKMDVDEPQEKSANEPVIKEDSNQVEKHQVTQGEVHKPDEESKETPQNLQQEEEKKSKTPSEKSKPQDEDSEGDLDFKFTINLDDEPEYKVSEPENQPKQEEKPATPPAEEDTNHFQFNIPLSPEPEPAQTTENKPVEAEGEKAASPKADSEASENIRIQIVDDDEEETGMIKISGALDDEQPEESKEPKVEQEEQPHEATPKDNESEGGMQFNIAFDDDDEEEKEEPKQPSHKSDHSSKIQLKIKDDGSEEAPGEHIIINMNDSEDGKEEEFTINIQGIDEPEPSAPDHEENQAIGALKTEEHLDAKEPQEENHSGRIVIPMDLEDEGVKENTVVDTPTLFKIPTSEFHGKETPTKLPKSRKRDLKENRKTQEPHSADKLSRISTPVAEEKKIEVPKIKNSIRNFYKLDMQKVTMQVVLEDTTKPSSDDNKTKLKGQAILMFNRKVPEDEIKDHIRDLRLDLHAKHMDITGIHYAQRYRKRDKNNKVIETLHEKKDETKHDYKLEEFDQFRRNCMHHEKYDKNTIFEKEGEFGDPFVNRPSIQTFEEYQSIEFAQEKRKGLLTIDNLLHLDVDELFPQNVDLIIDYEITDVLDYGLSFRKTYHPSGEGCYLATTHRYFETHYWMPCIDSLKQRNKWKITLVTNKAYQVACSGTLEKIMEIGDTDQLGYLYRVDHLTSACKIGFFVGKNFNELDNKYFSNTKRMEDYKKYFISDNQVVFDITETYEQVLGRDFPYESLNLVFVPNLFNGMKKKRRALCYSGVCFLDEELIFEESIIDKRHHTYFNLAYAVASNYFGCYIQEAAYTDYWLIEGI